MTVQDGRRTTVKLVKFSGGDNRMFTLQNASSGAAHEVYGDQHGDQFTKVVSDTQLQKLLDVYADKGLFQGAGPSVPSTARAAILVSQDGQRFALHGAHSAAERKRAFSEAQAYFLAVYNGATAYHSADISRHELQTRSEEQTTTPKTTGGSDGGRKQ